MFLLINNKVQLIMNYTKEGKMIENEKINTRSGIDKKKKDENLGLSSYLKEYLVECDFNQPSK